MKKEVLRIGNAQGFWGDSVDAPARLVEQQPNLDYLTLDYLSEVSMSIMAIQRDKDPSAGYARDFLDLVRSLIPFWKKGSKVKVISNCGGLNPEGCAKACLEILQKEKCGPKVIGVVSGDDVLPLLQSSKNNILFDNMETGEPLGNVRGSLVTANVYLGAKPIADALSKGADIVITGRVADPSLTVGPCAAHYGWSWQEYHALAGATVAGHLIECGTQVTGGFSTNWLEIPNTEDIGFPVVEVSRNGSFVITKPPNTGGIVDEQTVKEQLLYEIGDPAQYHSPDVTISFLSLRLEVVGQDRIKVSGAKGKPPLPTYKVSATYRNGFKAEGMITIFGQNAALKAAMCGENVLQKLKRIGYEFERSRVECLGAGSAAPTSEVMEEWPDPPECVLRMAVASAQEGAVERFAKEIAPLVTCGPQGVTGYASGRPKVRPIFGFWPCLIEAEKVKPQIKLLKVKK